MSAPISVYAIAIIAIMALMVFGTIMLAIRRYKTCPSNRILVKYGKVGAGKSALPIHGGATLCGHLSNSILIWT
ncbi:hypothetical protein QUF54_02700 [Candidatus Marithioploca araucensis]|uniref:Uncharacterized protein n=1 Tax=Candidatus Marithioploca araucensis TaxID=70273 RepID=A0ABT7VSL4_9GAMM|nr:hypothetical protein [Candidatus Marithioploca araucensis]